jgi:NCS1 family nucleobase:cation symporter-1
MSETAHALPQAAIPADISPDLWNDDLAPTRPAQRHWTARSYAALWVGMVACVPTYMLASGLISSGLSPVQAIALIFVGNLIVLIPMLLTGAMGTAYGVPFPVLLRASFGPRAGGGAGARLRGLRLVRHQHLDRRHGHLWRGQSVDA